MNSFFLSLILSINTVAFCAGPLTLPNEFTISEPCLSYSHQFEIATEKEPLAILYDDSSLLSTIVHLANQEGDTIATGNSISWSQATLKVTDGAENKLGYIDKVTLSQGPTYFIFNEKKELRALTRSKDHEILVYNPKYPDEIYAVISADPHSTPTQRTWNVLIFSKEIIEPHVFLVFSHLWIKDHRASYLRSWIPGQSACQ